MTCTVCGARPVSLGDQAWACPRHAEDLLVEPAPPPGVHVWRSFPYPVVPGGVWVAGAGERTMLVPPARTRGIVAGIAIAGIAAVLGLGLAMRDLPAVLWGPVTGSFAAVAIASAVLVRASVRRVLVIDTHLREVRLEVRGKCALRVPLGEIRGVALHVYASESYGDRHDVRLVLPAGALRIAQRGEPDEAAAIAARLARAVGVALDPAVHRDAPTG